MPAADDDHESQPLMADDVERQQPPAAAAGNTGTPDTSGTARPEPSDHHPDAPLDDRPDEQLEVADDSSSSPPTPRFVQDERQWKRFKWVPYPARRLARAAARWARGPTSPRTFRVRPLLPRVQHAPLWLLERLVPRRAQRVYLYVALVAVWLVVVAILLWRGSAATELATWGQPTDVGCGAAYWSPGNACGLDGDDCRPFDNTGFAFRCPASCSSYRVLNPRAVGDQEIIYRTMVVGGPANDSAADAPVYRGDSYICSAAIHAGVISDAKGGCGVVTLVGRSEGYVSSKRNAITSIGFDSYFPLSFTFEQGINCEARDMRWPILAVSIVFSVILSLFTTDAPLFFFTVFVAVFWEVGLASDPPSHYNVADLVSNLVGKLLPAMFCAWVMYDKMGVRRTLTGLTAQVEKTVLWLGACWVGALDNYTLSWIPLQRLTPHDLQQEPGAKAALTFIVLALAVVAATQVWFFQQEGRLLRYLRLYLVLGACLVVLAVQPWLSLRIHHYILGLLLLPGTSMQTRPALLYQGLLVGLFLNGVARWGFDSALQTSYALQGDAVLDSPLPVLAAPAVRLGPAVSNITFGWGPPPGLRYDGLSVLVNDVERFRSYFADDGAEREFVWTRDARLGLDEYFRFAYMEGSSSGDYTKAGRWTADGEWVEMAPGPSRVKSRSLDGEHGLVT